MILESLADGKGVPRKESTSTASKSVRQGMQDVEEEEGPKVVVAGGSKQGMSAVEEQKSTADKKKTDGAKAAMVAMKAIPDAPVSQKAGLTKDELRIKMERKKARFEELQRQRTNKATDKTVPHSNIQGPSAVEVSAVVTLEPADTTDAKRPLDLIADSIDIDELPPSQVLTPDLDLD